MHETVIANSIITQAKKQGKVKSIIVEVGDLGHLPAHEMKEVLETMTKWAVTVKKKRGTVQCVCGFFGEPKILEKVHGHTHFVCPSCGNTPFVVDGENIVLKEVEVE
ncbi:MAG: hydrogenase maturation nickel metallochaperone HypA [Nanoarchaeota archaeon]|nr:hydrogenase maturation nickel metallochaperone HypA [Nanoarchaeota archaeon]